MPEKFKSNGKNILNEDVSVNIETEYNVPGALRLMTSVTSGILLFSTSLYIHNNTLKEDFSDLADTFKYRILLSLSIFLSLFSFFDFIISCLIKILTDRNFKSSLTALVFYRKRIMLKFCLSLLTYGGMARIYMNMKEEDLSTKKFITDDVSCFTLSFGVFLAFILAKSVFMIILQIKLFYSTYIERIEENVESTKILEFLNRSTGQKMFSNINLWAKFVFSKISPKNDVLTYKNCKLIFGNEKTNEIFKLFDTNDDKSVTSAEFVSVYHGVIRQRYFLKKALLQKNTLLQKLDILVSSIFMPLGIFVSIAILGYGNYFRSAFSILSGMILSLSFIFSSVAGEMFKSLIFVFLVRPYEAGDVLNINNEVYLVEELGLLYSSYIINGNLTNIPNSKVMDKHIVNYRLCSFDEGIYYLVTNLLEFRMNETLFNNKIKEVMESDTRIYEGKSYFTNFKIMDDSLISFNIVVSFKISYQYVSGLIYNKDRFLFILKDILNDLKISHTTCNRTLNKNM